MRGIRRDDAAPRSIPGVSTEGAERQRISHRVMSGHFGEAFSVKLSRHTEKAPQPAPESAATSPPGAPTGVIRSDPILGHGSPTPPRLERFTHHAKPAALSHFYIMLYRLVCLHLSDASLIRQFRLQGFPDGIGCGGARSSIPLPGRQEGDRRWQEPSGSRTSNAREQPQTVCGFSRWAAASKRSILSKA